MERLGIQPDHGSVWKMFCRSGVPADQEEKRLIFRKCGQDEKNGCRKWPSAHSKWPGIGKSMAGKIKTSWRGCVAAMNVVSENKNLWHGSAIFRSREQRIRGNVIRMLTRGTITGKSIFPGQRWSWNAWAFNRIMAACGKCFVGRAHLQIWKKSGCFFWKCGYRKKRPPEMAASAFKMAGDR